MEAAIEPITQILKPLCKYVQYCRKFNENIEILKRRLTDLNSRKEDVELRLRTECRMRKLPRVEVNDWLQNSQRIKNEVENIERQVKKGKCLSRVCFGKVVVEKIEEVKEHYQHGAFESFVIDASPAAGVVLLTTTLVGETTAKKIMNKIWEFLMGYEVMKIGVCGIGGVGKTTIITHINNKLLKETDKFENVIWVTITQPLDLMKLQDQIAAALKEHLPRNEEIRKRARNLFKMLEGRKIVLILDDVWEAFQLEEVGIPEPTKENGCKLVITTRSQDVCHSMGCKTVQVRTLSEDEALKLFMDRVGFNILEVPTIKDFVKPVVEQCAGLPLAIVAVAGCMRGEYDICEWRNALEELSKSIQSVSGMERNVLRQLQFSYDRLKSKKLQHCFLYCALYPEDFKIPKEELIVYWIAEGLVDERDSMHATNDAGYSILNRLVNNCLLEIVDRGRCVKMHDLVRDMALHITSNKPLFMIKPQEGLSELPGEQEWKKNLEKVSLMGNCISEIYSSMSPNCQALSTLLLQRNPLQVIPEVFFVNMLSLKILDLSYTKIENLPNSISNLKNLIALLLNHCEQLTEVPSLKNLLALENLDLGFTNIPDMPEGIERLTKLRSLDLYLPVPVMLPTVMLHTHSRLQKLRIYCGSMNSEPALTSEEAIRFSRLDTFEAHFVSFYDFNMYVKSIAGQAPRRYRLLVASCLEEVPISEFFSLPEYDDYFPDVEGVNKYVTLYTTGEGEDLVVLSTDVQCLMVRVCPEISDIKVLMLGNYPNLKFLYLMDCWNLKKLVSPKLLLALQNLEVIEVEGCDKIEEIIADDNEDEEENEQGGSGSTIFALPKLREMRLKSLGKLKRICSGNAVLVCESLQQIHISRCGELKRFPVSLPLPAIKEIKVNKNWWDSLEWDNANAKASLQPFCKFTKWLYD
ncbi:disease resistance protein SUMM2-like [Mangifera indica]|uniref:disease resistance protein SUMM2-like n=1 Tax=Mangifera indica TaxID=29780 RepID=UPI001CFBCE91|nr:disease resistance protein SUMM2-like [Mangifera indica]XP_044485063.1 disease resistance protein SUMM2-like [Mangifera indica]XP_044485064.1 disease resistance protein SUMM2-like [Mangifera indica]